MLYNTDTINYIDNNKNKKNTDFFFNYLVSNTCGVKNDLLLLTLYVH